jgi:hypothetical protein
MWSYVTCGAVNFRATQIVLYYSHNPIKEEKMKKQGPTVSLFFSKNK